MSIETVKDTITLVRQAGKETAQVLLEGDFIVPDVKPDIAAVLRADAEVFAEKKDIGADKLNFVCKLNLNVLYLAKGADKPVHSLSVQTSADDFINIDGLNREMWADVSAKIENIDFKTLNDRKISYRAVVEVEARAEERRAFDYIAEIGGLPASQIKKKSISVNKTVENRADRFAVKDDLAVAAGKPAIRELLQTTVVIADKDVKVSNGRVHINGDLVVCALYRGDDDGSVIEFTEHELPFNGAIDITGARESMFGDVELAISSHNERVTRDSDGEDRIIAFEATISVTAKVSSQSEVSAVSDVYALSKTTVLSTQTVNCPQLVCRNKNQTTVKDVVTIEETAPDILQVFRVTGSARLNETKVVDDKVIAEGVIDADILYIAKNDDAPLFNHRCALPFRQVIETKGAAEGMEARVEPSVDHVSFNMLSDREVEARFLVSFNTKVTHVKECVFVTDARFDDIDKETLDAQPSMVIYAAQKGDTLWEIAKKFNVEIDELTSINEIENEKIKEGQKLLILKKPAA